jgi:hypothetical protein
MFVVERFQSNPVVCPSVSDGNGNGCVGSSMFAVVVVVQAVALIGYVVFA